MIMIKVLLIDDHALIRAVIINLLKAIDDIRVIGEVSNGEDAIKFIRNNDDVDVVLVDISMPGMSGIEVTRRLMQMKPTLKIIALTSHDDDLYTAQVLKVGASGYLTKSTNIEELNKAIHAVYADQHYLTPHVAEQMASRYISGEQTTPFDGLKPRELEILLLISRGKDASAIAEQLFLSAKTVNSYRYRLYKKLNIKSDVELTKLAIQYGLIDLEDI